MYGGRQNQRGCKTYAGSRYVSTEKRGKVSREEQKTVEETIRDDLAYDLGVVEKKEKRHTQTFFLMLAGMLLSGGLLWFTKALADEPRELLYILFWFAPVV